MKEFTTEELRDIYEMSTVLIKSTPLDDDGNVNKYINVRFKAKGMLQGRPTEIINIPHYDDSGVKKILICILISIIFVGVVLMIK